jgi:CheY-like chemotaxis protein
MAQEQSGFRLQGLQILIVEDDVLLAMALERLLEIQGCSILGPAPKQSKALALLERTRPDAAVMDLNLRGERPLALAEALVRLKVPFVILSGYSKSETEDPIFRHAPRLEKPATSVALIAALTEAIASAAETP